MRTEKTPARLAVEEALRNTTEKTPLTAHAISHITGYPVAVVKMHLNNMITHGGARNIAPTNIAPGKFTTGLYVGAHIPVPVMVRESVMKAPAYVPPKPSCAREGAMQAFSLPSLQEERRVPYRAPLLVGGSLE